MIPADVRADSYKCAGLLYGCLLLKMSDATEYILQGCPQGMAHFLPSLFACQLGKAAGRRGVGLGGGQNLQHTELTVFLEKQALAHTHF